jgi:hypothetical protein
MVHLTSKDQLVNTVYRNNYSVYIMQFPFVKAGGMYRNYSAVKTYKILGSYYLYVS